MSKDNVDVPLPWSWLAAILLIAVIVFTKVSCIFGSSTPARVVRLPSETRELFVECLRIHPRTADVVLLARSPVDACLEAAQTLTSTTP